jgi:chromosomal replication initiation ATPase DnaA
MNDYRVLDIIVEVVCRESDISEKMVVRLNRSPAVCKARDTICYIARVKTDLSFPEIGQRLFGRHHSTIISCVHNETIRLERQFPLRADGRTLKEWHEYLWRLISARIAEEIDSKEEKKDA